MTDTPGTSSPQPADVAPDPAQGAIEVGAIEVVRSAEQLQVSRTVRASGRAVLRKYVVTETVTQTFEVRREEIRLDLEPANGTDGPPAGDRLFDDRFVDVVLHREVPVVQLRVEAVEKVRLHIDTLTEQVPVSADLRTEQIDLEGPPDLAS